MKKGREASNVGSTPVRTVPPPPARTRTEYPLPLSHPSRPPRPRHAMEPVLDNIIGSFAFWEVSLTRYTETQIDVRASETKVHSPVNLVNVYSSAHEIQLLSNKCQKCAYYC